MPLDLENVQSGYNLAVINENFQRIEDSWDEKLDRVNSGSFYNQMEQELDMNSNHVINSPAPTEETHLVRLKELNDLVFNSGATGVIPLVQPRQVGDGTTTVFAAPNSSVVSAATMFISIDGVMQRPFTDYDVLAANQVTFTEAVPNLATIDITYFEPSVIENPDVSLRTAKATGTTEVRTLGDRFADAVNVKDFGAVGDGVTDDTSAIQQAVSLGNSSGSTVFVPAGNYRVTSTITVPAGGCKIKGSGNSTKARIEAYGDFTVFEHTTRFCVEDLSIVQMSGVKEGIGIGNKRTDGSDNQANYCNYNNVRITGFDYSWWMRASLWCSWTNCYSNSLVGIRFARNADPYDRGIPEAPGAWNSFSPTIGWFHNQGTVSNSVFEDDECGIWGCMMGYAFDSLTTQGQASGDIVNNKLIPVTEHRTGMWFEIGRPTQNDAYPTRNCVTSFYAESCRRPILVDNARGVTIDTMFAQGGSSSNRYRTPIEVRNRGFCYTDNVTVSDWYDYQVILENNGTLYGQSGGATSPAASSLVDSTSNWYANREQEFYKHSYVFTADANGSGTNWTIPVTLENTSNYELSLMVLIDGFNLVNEVYDISRWTTDALTDITPTHDTLPTALSIASVGNQLVLTWNTNQSASIRATFEEKTAMISQVQSLPRN